MPNDIRFLAVTPNIDRAIRQKLLGADAATNLSIPDQPTPRQTLVPDNIQQSIGGATSYNGYFTIKVRNGENGRPSHIVVCDGATYDAEKHTSGDMLIAVNGVISWFPYWEEGLKSEYGSGQKYIVAEYVPPRVNDNNETVKEKIQLVIVDDPVKYANNEEKKDEKITERYTQLIGSFTWNSTAGTVSIIQRHGTANAYYANNGMLYIEYFSACDPVQKATDTEG